MASIRSNFLLLCFSLLAASLASAQNSPLTITGNVMDVNVGGRVDTVRISNDNVFDGVRYERRETWFDVRVLLRYCNKGEETLIVPTRLLSTYGSRKIIFLELPWSGSKVSESVASKSLWGDRDPSEQMLKELAKAEPERSSFATIAPGTCYETGDMIIVESGFKLTSIPQGQNRRDIDVAVPEHRYFKIRYALSMKDPLPVSEAKRRWSRFGKLLTTADGDFFLETDVILNKLPE